MKKDSTEAIPEHISALYCSYAAGHAFFVMHDPCPAVNADAGGLYTAANRECCCGIYI